MKKRLLSALLCVAMVASLVVGCGGKEEPAAEAPAATEEAATEEAAPADDNVYALIVKSAGNPYNEKEAEGFTTAMDELGLKYVVKYPEQATADAQITMINELVAQNVSSIAIAANDGPTQLHALSRTQARIFLRYEQSAC